MITQGSLGDSWAMDPWNPWTHGTQGVFFCIRFSSKEANGTPVRQSNDIQASKRPSNFILKMKMSRIVQLTDPMDPPWDPGGPPMKSARVSHEDPGMCFK